MGIQSVFSWTSVATVCKHGVFHQYVLEYEIEGFLSGQNEENSTGTGMASLQCVSAHGFEGGL